MKQYKHLYEKVCSLDNLRFAFKKAKKGKSKRKYVIEFEADLENELNKLKEELESLTYQPKPLKTFVIRDPKTRVISASDFRDRVVHHALCNVIEPIFDKTFIHDCYANRKKKGTLAALQRFNSFMRKVTRNGKLVKNAINNNKVVGYALKADIKHYFDTVDHEVLMKIIGKKINDDKVLWLARKILENHNGKIPGKGMPIGNLTSQFFANLYLNELDYYAKHVLKDKFYLRYVDDFVILHRSKEKLILYKWLISNFLKSAKLELHQEKSKIAPLRNGINLLGYRVFYHYKLLRKSNMLKASNKLGQLCNLLKERKVSAEYTIQSLNGWLAYAKVGNTYRMRKKMLKPFEEFRIKL
jgi:retron-type reverse transcriptase